MPIYEYLCHDCNTVYQFFSRTASPKASPSCPKASDHSELERQMSGFAIGAPSSASPVEAHPGNDPASLARMEGLMGKLGAIDENDPKAVGRLMREMATLSGDADPRMDEAIRRLEGGEDPERIEALLDGDSEADGGSAIRRTAPRIDSSLYEM